MPQESSAFGVEMERVSRKSAAQVLDVIAHATTSASINLWMELATSYESLIAEHPGSIAELLAHLHVRFFRAVVGNRGIGVYLLHIHVGATHETCVEAWRGHFDTTLLSRFCSCEQVMVDDLIRKAAASYVHNASKIDRKKSIGSSLFADVKAARDGSFGAGDEKEVERDDDSTSQRLSDVAELCCALAGKVSPDSAPSLFDLMLKVCNRVCVCVCVCFVRGQSVRQSLTCLFLVAIFTHARTCAPHRTHHEADHGHASFHQA